MKMLYSRKMPNAKRELEVVNEHLWKKRKFHAFLSQEAGIRNSSYISDSLLKINEANMNWRKNYSREKNETLNDDVVLLQHKTVENQCKSISEIQLIKDSIQICQALPINTINNVQSIILEDESHDGRKYVEYTRQTDSSPIISFWDREDFLPKTPAQNIQFNNENIELDAEFCTDWFNSEVRENSDVFCDEVKIEMIQDFVEGDKVNEKKTLENTNESCNRSNSTTTDTDDLTFSCNGVLLQRKNIKRSNYKIPITCNDSEFEVEKLSIPKNVSEVKRKTEIPISDLVSEKKQITHNPTLSSTNKYIFNHFLKQNKNVRDKQMEPFSASYLSKHNITPFEKGKKNHKHNLIRHNPTVNRKPENRKVSENYLQKIKNFQSMQKRKSKLADFKADDVSKGEKESISENLRIARERADIHNSVKTSVTKEIMDKNSLCRNKAIQSSGGKVKQKMHSDVSNVNSQTLLHAENKRYPASVETEDIVKMHDTKNVNFNHKESLKKSNHGNVIFLKEMLENPLWRWFDQPDMTIHQLINNRKQSCNSHLKEPQCTSEELTSSDKMKFLDKEEIKKEHKENIGDLSEYVNSWKRKNPWMKYHSSVFYCKICLNSQPIYKVKSLNQIFKVAFYLRQHESSAEHKQVMLNLSNKLIKHTIEHIKRTAFKQTSKEALFFSLSEHLRLTDGMNIHECNEYIFSTVFKEFTTFLEEIELAFLNSNMTKSFSYIIDECRQILIVRTISTSGHPVEILITKPLEKTGIFKFGAIIGRYLSNAVFAKRMRCGMCDICKKTRLSDTNQTLPVRYPNAIGLANMLQNDPAVIKYIEFVKKNSETAIKSHCSGIIKEFLDWTHLELLNILKLHFPVETKTFSYIEVLLQIILKLNKANIKRSLLPQDLNSISNLLDELKCTLNSTSIEFIQLFLGELLLKGYHDGASNVKCFENIFNPYFMMNVKKYPVYYEAFLQIFRWFQKHFPEESPDSMMNHLAMFGQYVDHTRNMSSYVLALSTILQMFQEDLLLRQQFSVVHKFYKLIALLPFLCASHEISFYGVCASFSLLIKKYGRPLAYQIMRIMHADDALVHQFQENRI